MALAFDIREATPMDSEAIGRIHVETWQATYAGMLDPGYLARLDAGTWATRWRESIGRLRAGTARRGKVLVVTAPGQGAIGFGSCGRARSHTLPYDGEIETLYIHPDWQGQGLGRELLVALFEELSAAGFLSALVWVVAANPSRFFYEAMGGERLAEKNEPFAGRPAPQIAYGWDDLATWLAAWR